jgi:hypothetical protein
MEDSAKISALYTKLNSIVSERKKALRLRSLTHRSVSDVSRISSPIVPSKSGDTTQSAYNKKSKAVSVRVAQIKVIYWELKTEFKSHLDQ